MLWTSTLGFQNNREFCEQVPQGFKTTGIFVNKYLRVSKQQEILWTSTLEFQNNREFCEQVL
jgi:hypothetical protein